MRSAYHTNIIQIGSSKGIKIPQKFLKMLGEKVIIRPSKEGLVIQPEGEEAVPPREEWDAIFARCDTNLETDFKEWDTTLLDGLE